MPDLTRGHTYSASDSVTHSNLNNLVGNATLNDNAVTEAKINASAVTNAKVSASADIALSKLAEGTDAQAILCNVSGVPTYVTVAGDVTLTNAGVSAIGSDKVLTAMILDGNVTGPKIAMGSDAAGDVLYHNGTDYVRLPKGTAAQLLKMNSAANAPEWSSVHAPNVEQVVLTAQYEIYNHSSNTTDTAVEGANGAIGAMYVFTDGTNSFDDTITRRALDSKVRIDFVMHIETSAYASWGKVQRSLDDGVSWSDTAISDSAGGSDLRQRAQFSAGPSHHQHYNIPVTTFCYIDTPAGGTGEEAVRYRVICGTHASEYLTTNRDRSQDDGTGNGTASHFRAVSQMILTEIPV